MNSATKVRLAPINCTILILVALVIFNMVLVVVLFLTMSGLNEDTNLRIECKRQPFEKFLLRISNPFKNISAYGQFHVRDHDGTALKSCVTSWLQDNLNRRLKITVGVIGTRGWVGDYYFLDHGTYVVTPMIRSYGHASAVCTYIRDWNYSAELDKYRNNLLYEGKRIWETDKKHLAVHVFSGVVNKTDTAEVVERILEEETMAPLMLRRIPLDRMNYAYTESIYELDKVTIDHPIDEPFIVPSICIKTTN